MLCTIQIKPVSNTNLPEKLCFGGGDFLLSMNRKCGEIHLGEKAEGKYGRKGEMASKI